jgi:hypothetical protein
MLLTGLVYASVHASLIDSSDLKVVEEQYNIDPDTVRDAAQGLNVGNQKGAVPSVSVAFTPVSPKPGEMMTARATAIFFTTTKEKLYYTWYLKRKGCDSGAEDRDDKREDKDGRRYTKKVAASNEFCDKDGDNDGYVTPNDWKISAMKLIVRGGYDPNPTENDDNKTPNFAHNPAPDTGDDKDGYKAVFGGDGEIDSLKNFKYCYIQDVNTGKNYELNSSFAITTETAAKIRSSCYNGSFASHLFANPDMDGANPGLQPGDGNFGAKEEAFWGTDPHNPSTAQDGRKDEAAVVGVGADELSWIYFTGDQVGVAVECVSMTPTKHTDSSKMIMWGWPKNLCAPKLRKNLAPPFIDAYQYQDKNDYTVVIPVVDMTEHDFDKCFHDNLLDPAKGGQPTNMKVTLSSSPQNPVAMVFGPNDKNPLGDTVNVQALTEDSTADPATIYYKWDVRVSVNGTMNPNFNDQSQWASITQELVKNNSVGTVEGNGKKELYINLNFSQKLAAKFPNASSEGGVGYLYVKVQTRENFEQEQGRGGTGYMVIKFTLVGAAGIDVSTVKTVSGADANTPLKLAIDQSICMNGISAVRCKVMPNQIIGVSAPQNDLYDTYLWTINKKPLECSSNISSECTDGKTSNKAFFPILGNPGEQYTVELVESNAKTGESLTLNRVFQIVEPSVLIGPIEVNGVSAAYKKLIGFYQGLDGSEVADYSPNTFEIATGQTLTLQPLFNATNLQGNTKLLWVVDGVPAEDVDPTTGIMTLPITQTDGSILQIDLKGVYYQSQDIRRALLDIWGVSPTISTETNFETHASIVVVTQEDEDDGIGMLSLPNKYFGAVISYIPESVLFVLRLSLSLALALFFVGFIQSFIPATTVTQSAPRDNQQD